VFTGTGAKSFKVPVGSKKLWITAIAGTLAALYLLLPASPWRMPGAGELALVRPLAPIPSKQQLTTVPDTAFFYDRNRITIRVPRDMTLDEFVRIYQLQTVRGDLEHRLRRTQLKKNESIDAQLTPGTSH
jgi:hypothetical protein